MTITALISEIHHGSPFEPLARTSQLMPAPDAGASPIGASIELRLMP